MSDKTGIEWTDATWNPLVGCSVKSPGCKNCYAMPMAHRIQAMSKASGRSTHYEGTTRDTANGPVFSGRINLAPPHILNQPLNWKRPRVIFVNSMSDLFHENVPWNWIDEIFTVMAECPQHIFQILTKRSARMRDYILNFTERRKDFDCHSGLDWCKWPLPNVWLGVSVEDQKRADERIPDLLETPAAVRFLSCEPLLGPLDLTRIDLDGYSEIYPLKGTTDCEDDDGNKTPDLPSLDWVIVGGESGPDARPMHPHWARTIRDQCQAEAVPFFFKQWGEWRPPGPNEYFNTAHGRAGKPPAFLVSKDGTVHCFLESSGVDAHSMLKVGKKAAGRTLDGRTHEDFPVYIPTAA